ncbi:hypothetical protein OIU78_018033 [Salix suchowensis]|nr:hypothetical protein OIU78_018033 [Salix suchowensis]
MFIYLWPHNVFTKEDRRCRVLARVLLEFVFCAVKLSCGGGERANTQLLYLSCTNICFSLML